jgi:hypothetical protein
LESLRRSYSKLSMYAWWMEEKINEGKGKEEMGD